MGNMMAPIGKSILLDKVHAVVVFIYMCCHYPLMYNILQVPTLFINIFLSSFIIFAMLVSFKSSNFIIGLAVMISEYTLLIVPAIALTANDSLNQVNNI